MKHSAHIAVLSFLSTAVLLVVSGCAGTQGVRGDDADRVSALSQSLDETNAKLEELNNKFLLLHEKIESLNGEKRASAQDPSAFELPEGLRVVKLGEEPKAQDSKSEKKASRGAQELYYAGQDLFIAGNYDEAREAFLELVSAHPKSSLGDNALYWTGESYYVNKEFDKALPHFQEIIQRYPDENKAPDASLKIGYSHLELGNRKKAKESFEALLKRYPKSEAAEKAKKALKKLNQKEGIQ